MTALAGLVDDLSSSCESFRRLDYHLTADDLRPGALGSPARVAFVVLPSYAAGPITRLVPLARGEAVMEMVRETFNLERFGGRGVETLGRVVRAADCYRLTSERSSPPSNSSANCSRETNGRARIRRTRAIGVAVPSGLRR